MLQDIKNTIKQSAIYGLSRISFKFVAFLLFPLYSIYFSVDDYGIIVRGEIFWQLIQSSMLYAIETAIIRWYTLIPEPQKKKSLIVSVFSFLLVLNILLLAIALIAPKLISSLLFTTPDFGLLVQICLVVSMFETLVGLPLVILRIQEKATKYSIIVILETLVSFGLQFYFITSTSQKLNGIFISKAIASLLIFFILMPTLVRSINLKIDLKILKEVLIFSFPLMIASFVSFLFNSQDRFILGYLSDSREVGLYGLGSNIAGILVFLLVSPFALAFPVLFWKKIDDGNAARYFTKTMTYSFLAFVFGAMVLSLITPNFIKVFARNPDYWSAKSVVPILSFSRVLYGMQVIGFMSFYQHKKTSIVLLILVISAIFNIILNLILVPPFKMYGASVSTFLSYFISTILIYRLSKRYYFIKWENYKLTISILISALLVAPFYLFNIENLILSITLKTLAIIIFPFILYIFHFYEDIELVTVKNYLRKSKKFIIK